MVFTNRLQRYNKNCTYASVRAFFFEKKAIYRIFVCFERLSGRTFEVGRHSRVGALEVTTFRPGFFLGSFAGLNPASPLIFAGLNPTYPFIAKCKQKKGLP